MTPVSSAQDYFRTLLLTVVGGAFGAAGYRLDERPGQWAGGLFRFVRPLPDGAQAVIEFQHLAYAEGYPSRFKVTLARLVPAQAPLRRSLSALVVADFGVAILPSADHWWSFSSTEELGRALAEAGSLAVGYGMPWLAGELLPPSA